MGLNYLCMVWPLILVACSGALAGSRARGISFTEILTISDAVAIVDIVSAEECRRYRRDRRLVYDVRAKFNWSTFLRECPYLPIDRSHEQIVEFIRFEYDDTYEPGRYLVFLVQQRPGYYREASDRESIFRLTGDLVTLPSHWMNGKNSLVRPSSEGVSIAEVRELLDERMVPNQRQQFDASNIECSFGIEQWTAKTSPGYYRVLLATRTLPGGGDAGYLCRVLGFCRYSPRVYRQLRALGPVRRGKFLINGIWKSGYFEIDEIVDRATGQSLVLVEPTIE